MFAIAPSASARAKTALALAASDDARGPAALNPPRPRQPRQRAEKRRQDARFFFRGRRLGGG
jgi:hypothetical protein